jgi:hypothetical protein
VKTNSKIQSNTSFKIQWNVNRCRNRKTARRSVFTFFKAGRETRSLLITGLNFGFGVRSLCSAARLAILVMLDLFFWWRSVLLVLHQLRPFLPLRPTPVHSPMATASSYGYHHLATAVAAITDVVASSSTISLILVVVIWFDHVRRLFIAISNSKPRFSINLSWFSTDFQKKSSNFEI